MEKIEILNDMNNKQLQKAFEETIKELETNKDKIFRIGLKKRIDKIKKVIIFNWILKNLSKDTIKKLQLIN